MIATELSGFHSAPLPPQPGPGAHSNPIGSRPPGQRFPRILLLDWEYAFALYELLVPHLSVFLDRRSLPEGCDFEIAIPEAQRQARMTIAIIGEQHEKAYYARAEIVTAVDLSRKDPTRYSLVPVYLRGIPASEDIPYPLKLKHSFDFVREGGWGPIVERIRRLFSGQNGIVSERKPATDALMPDPSMRRDKLGPTAHTVSELEMHGGNITNSEALIENRRGPSNDSTVRDMRLKVDVQDVIGSKVVIKNDSNDSGGD